MLRKHTHQKYPCAVSHFVVSPEINRTKFLVPALPSAKKIGSFNTFSTRPCQRFSQGLKPELTFPKPKCMRLIQQERYRRRLRPFFEIIANEVVHFISKFLCSGLDHPSVCPITCSCLDSSSDDRRSSKKAYGIVNA